MVHQTENFSGGSGVIAKYLSKNDLSVNKAAVRLGVAWATLGRWLAGDSLPPRTRIPALASALGLPVEELTALVARERSRRVVGRAGHRAARSCPRRSARGRS